MPGKEIPGPGQYEYSSGVLHDKKNFNASGQSSVFTSKVPNCCNAKPSSKMVPGPGHYEK